MKSGRRFIIAGIIASGTTFLLRHGLMVFLPFDLAMMIAIGASLILGYGLNRLYVFGATGRPIAAEFVAYLGSMAVVTLALYLELSRKLGDDGMR